MSGVVRLAVALADRIACLYELCCGMCVRGYGVPDIMRHTGCQRLPLVQRSAMVVLDMREPKGNEDQYSRCQFHVLRIDSERAAVR